MPRKKVVSRNAKYSRTHRLKTVYNLTDAEYDKILEHQGGVCAICGGKRRYRLDVDHCHKTGVVRGLLCKLCNRRLLPAARDTIEFLLRAIEYLKNPPATAALGEPRYVPEPEAVDE